MSNLSAKESTALVRKDIKAAFPGTKFSVTTYSGMMYQSATVKWIGGPSLDEVQDVVRKYATTRLDYYTDNRESVPGTIGCLDNVSLERRSS